MDIIDYNSEWRYEINETDTSEAVRAECPKQTSLVWVMFPLQTKLLYRLSELPAGARNVARGISSMINNLFQICNVSGVCDYA